MLFYLGNTHRDVCINERHSPECTQSPMLRMNGDTTRKIFLHDKETFQTPSPPNAGASVNCLRVKMGASGLEVTESSTA